MQVSLGGRVGAGTQVSLGGRVGAGAGGRGHVWAWSTNDR